LLLTQEKKQSNSYIDGVEDTNNLQLKRLTGNCWTICLVTFI